MRIDMANSRNYHAHIIPCIVYFLLAQLSCRPTSKLTRLTLHFCSPDHKLEDADACSWPNMTMNMNPNLVLGLNSCKQIEKSLFHSPTWTYKLKLANPSMFCNLYKCSAFSIVVINLLLIKAGDTELNPGPQTWPCGWCGENCTWKQKSIDCDTCKQYYHLNCSLPTSTRRRTTDIPC